MREIGRAAERPRVRTSDRGADICAASFIGSASADTPRMCANTLDQPRALTMTQLHELQSVILTSDSPIGSAWIPRAQGTSSSERNADNRWSRAQRGGRGGRHNERGDARCGL